MIILKELQDVEKYIYGVHIHETLELSDHWCPYVHSKEHYFDHFLEVIDHAPVKVYELKAACQPDEIDESHEQITGKIAALHGSADEQKN